MEAIISVLGSIASFVGTGISWFQAYKSSKAKNAAEKYRNEIIDVRKTSDISSLIASLRHALGSMRKYGPASTVQSLEGVNPQRDAEDVQSFVELLSEHRGYFSGTDNPASQLIDSANSAINSFVSAFPDVIQVRRSGMELYGVLNEFLPLLTKKLEKLREKIVAEL